MGRAIGQGGSWLRRGSGPTRGEPLDVSARGLEAGEVVPEGRGRPGTQARRAVTTRQDAGRQGQGDDSYLDEHFHVHERLGQDGETGAQEHLTGRVRHDGTRGRTDRRSHQATQPVPDHVSRARASLARPRRACSGSSHCPAQRNGRNSCGGGVAWAGRACVSEWASRGTLEKAISFARA